MESPKKDYNYRPRRGVARRAAQPGARLADDAPRPARAGAFAPKSFSPRGQRVQDTITYVFVAIGFAVLIGFQLYMWLGAYGDMVDTFIAWATTGIVGTTIIEIPVFALYVIAAFIAGRLVP